MNANNSRREALLFLMAIICGAVTAIIFAPSALKLFGFSNMTIQEIITRPEESVGRSLLLYQATGTVLMFLLPGVFIINRWSQGNNIPQLKKHKWGFVDTLLALALLPLLLPLMDWLSSLWNTLGQKIPLLSDLFDQYDANTALIEKMIFLPSIGDSIFSVLVFVIIAAISEEIFFRGAIQRMLHNNRKPYAAILLGAMAFAIGHMNIVQLPFLIIAGSSLGFIYWISGRIWVSISAHVLHNGLTYFWTLSSGPGSYGEPSEATLDTWQILLCTILALSAGFALMKMQKRVLLDR